MLTSCDYCTPASVFNLSGFIPFSFPTPSFPFLPIPSSFSPPPTPVMLVGLQERAESDAYTQSTAIITHPLQFYLGTFTSLVLTEHVVLMTKC